MMTKFSPQCYSRLSQKKAFKKNTKTFMYTQN